MVIRNLLKILYFSSILLPVIAQAAEPSLTDLKAELAVLMKKVHALESAQNYQRENTVKTSSVIGLRSKIDGSDLLVSLPSMNEDIRLLEQRRILAHEQLGQFRPSIQLSGGISGQAYWQSVGGVSQNDIDLTNFMLTVFSVVNPWVQMVGTINYDNDPFDDEFGLRISNSRIYLKRAFMTIGNLQESKFYASLGQMYLPFGRYNSSALSTPFTALLGRVSARNLVVGYVDDAKDHRFLFSGFLGTGDASTAGEEDRVNEGGVNALFSWHNDVTFGMGWLYNLGAANGVIGALGVDNHAQGHVVHGLDAYLALAHGSYQLKSEYLTALSAFAAGDTDAVTIVDQRPKTFHTELALSPVSGTPLLLAMDYNLSWHAEHLMARRSLGLIISQAFWRDTIGAIEFRHNWLYDDGSSHADNRMLAQFSVYF